MRDYSKNRWGKCPVFPHGKTANVGNKNNIFRHPLADIKRLGIKANEWLGYISS